MEVFSFVGLSLCIIAHCSFLCAALSRNTNEDSDGLSSALKSESGRHGYRSYCETVSDCTGNKGCFTFNLSGICLPCGEEKDLKENNVKYDVSGCNQTSGHDGLSTWIIVAVVVGALLAVVVLSLVVCCIVHSCRLAKRRKNQKGQHGQYPEADEQEQYQGEQGQGEPPSPSGDAYGQAPGAQYEQANISMPSNNIAPLLPWARSCLLPYAVKRVEGGRNDSGSSGSGSSSGSNSESAESSESVEVSPGPVTMNPPKTKHVTHKAKTLLKQ